MTLLRYIPSQPDGTNVTTSNLIATPGGKQATTVSLGTAGNTAQYSSDHPKNGINPLKVYAQASTAINIRLPFDTTDKYSAAFSFYYRVDVALAASVVMATVRPTSGTIISLAVSTTGAVSVRNSGGTLGTTVAGAVQTGQWARIEVTLTVATSSTGAVSLNVYNDDGTTPVGSYSTSAADLGTLPVVAADIGSPNALLSSFTSGLVQYFIAPSLADNTTSQNGPWVTNTINIVHSENGGYAVVDFRSSSPGGLTHSISPSSGVLEPLEGLFLVPQTSNTQAFAVTTTDGISPVVTNINIPAIGSGDSLRSRVYNGSAWV